MAFLESKYNSVNTWNKTLAKSDFNKTMTIETNGKYLDRDIKIVLPSLETLAGTTTRQAGDGYCALKDSKNISFTTTNNDIYVDFEGKGAVSTGNGIVTSGSTTSNSATAKKYISGVKLTTPTSGTKSFEIEVPNGSSTDFIKFTIKVDSNSNVWVE